jgi:hypothetical protein
MLVLYHDFHNKKQEEDRKDFRGSFNSRDCKYNIAIYARAI